MKGGIKNNGKNTKNKMNQERIKKFYEKKIDKFYYQLDLALDMGANRQRINYLEDKILIWEAGYKLNYGNYYMVDDRKKICRGNDLK